MMMMRQVLNRYRDKTRLQVDAISNIILYAWHCLHQALWNNIVLFANIFVTILQQNQWLLTAESWREDSVC